MSVLKFSKSSEFPLNRLRSLVSHDMEKVDNLVVDLIQSKITLIPDIAKYTLSAGGKRLRPLLTLACAKLCEYEGTSHIDLASAVEFIHTATLLHDDVVDESSLRRGRNTANNVWGNKETILVGDFLLSKAFQLMGTAKSLKVFEILSNASNVIAEGEVHQLSLIGKLAFDEKNYLKIITAKTAELFASACEVGAAIAQHKDANIFRDYGMNMGIAFQIVDDALDYSSKQDILGKKIGDDFAEGKITLPVIIAYNHSNDEEKTFWHRVFTKNSQKDDDLIQAITLIEKYHAIEKSVDTARKYAYIAHEKLSDIQTAESSSTIDIKESLLDILSFIVNREY